MIWELAASRKMYGLGELICHSVTRTVKFTPKPAMLVPHGLEVPCSDETESGRLQAI